MDGTTILIIVAAIVIIGGLVLFLRSQSGSRKSISESFAPPASSRSAKPPTPPTQAGGYGSPPPQDSPKRSGRGLFDDQEQATPTRETSIPAPGAGPRQRAKPSAPPPPPQAQPAPSTGAHRAIPPQPAPAAERAKEETDPAKKTMPATPAPRRAVPIDDLLPKPAPIPSPVSEPAEPSPVAPAAEVAPDDAFGGAADLDELEKAAAPSTALIPTEDVRFTVYYPKEATIDTWYTLLTYAHIEAALAKVQADAQRFKGEMGDSQREARSGDVAKLARGTEITIMPQMEGVTFNPERISFKWVEDLHRAEFRLKANKDLAGLAGNGTVLILVGPLIVGTVKFGMLFDEATIGSASEPPTFKQVASESATAKLYKQEQIFASYSHKDTPVVIACRDAYRALGYDVLIDIDDLRSGEKWNDALMQMIDRADIFQLFWSERSAQSKYCKEEWEHALEKSKTKGEGFIRPVYWEKPLVNPPPELGNLHFAYVPLTKPEQP